LDFVVRTKTSCQADKILQAAAHLFGRQRFHEVRMDDIADAADVGKGTLYRYFQDKDELYLGVLRWQSDQFLTRVHAAIDQEMHATAQLVSQVRVVIDYFDEHPHLLLLIQRAEVNLSEDQTMPWQQTRTELTRLTLEVFRKGELGGEFKVSEPELAALILLGGLRSVIRFGKIPRPPDLPERIVRGFLEGVQHYG
jgi:AcrR family transcriptional regulator